MRKAVRNARPENLEAYIIAYCNSVMRGDKPPDTIDPDLQHK